MRNLDFSGLLFKFIAVIVAVTLPIRPSMVAIGCLIFADFISGIAASVKEGKPITSSGFRRTFVKLFMYQIAIIVAFILELFVFEGLPAVKALVALLGLIEAKSFFENLNRLTGVDLWGQIVSKLNIPDAKAKDESK